MVLHASQPLSTEEVEARGGEGQLVLQSCVVYVGRNLKIMTCQILTWCLPLSFSFPWLRQAPSIIVARDTSLYLEASRWMGHNKLSSLRAQGEGLWVSKWDSLGRLAREELAKGCWCLCPVLGSGWQAGSRGKEPPLWWCPLTV